jgi:hypothetical protein
MKSVNNNVFLGQQDCELRNKVRYFKYEKNANVSVRP